MQDFTICNPAHCKGKKCNQRRCLFIHVFKKKDKDWTAAVKNKSVSNLNNVSVKCKHIKWIESVKPFATQEIVASNDKLGISKLTEASSGSRKSEV